jgi:geranylgeranyl reductase
MRKEFDVIVVGSGPGGLECANQLKNSALSVLLLEKNTVIGPKTCAGGITQVAAYIDIPEGRARNFKDHELVIGNSNYSLSLVNPLKTISRYDLGQYQLEKISRSENIELLAGTTVKSIEKNRVMTDNGSFQYKYLVGADGSTSVVRKHLGIKSEMCIGMYYEIPVVTDRLIWYCTHKKLKSGYIWIFPHRDHTNVGVYFNPRHILSRDAKRVLMDFLEDNRYSFSEDRFRAAPVNYSYRGCVFDNIFLIGDAAGLASKSTGEGISFAMVSGKEIGKKILKQDYTMMELHKILMYKKRQENLLKLYEMFPWLRKFIFRICLTLLRKESFQAYLGL